MENTNVTNYNGIAADIGLLVPEKCRLYINPNGFTAMEYDGREIKRVKLARSLPYSEPFGYVCVFDMEDNEIGIIKSVDELEEESAGVVRSALENRYYCPEVTQIVSIKEKLGYFYFDVRIGEHKKVFAVKDVSRNIKQLDENRIIIFDVDGNRYYISDIWSIDKSSRRKIEPYLY